MISLEQPDAHIQRDSASTNSGSSVVLETASDRGSKRGHAERLTFGQGTHDKSKPLELCSSSCLLSGILATCSIRTLCSSHSLDQHHRCLPLNNDVITSHVTGHTRAWPRSLTAPLFPHRPSFDYGLYQREIVSPCTHVNHHACFLL
jgi:hypothetical protein